MVFGVSDPPSRGGRMSGTRARLGRSRRRGRRRATPPAGGTHTRQQRSRAHPRRDRSDGNGGV